MRPFTVILLVLFGLFIVGGVIAIAMSGKSGGGNTETPAVAEVWGVLPSAVVNGVVDAFNQDNDNVLQVTYRQVASDDFDSELAESLAAGTGPDAVILSQAQLVRHENKLYNVAFESYPERLFRDTFAEGTEIFMTNTGVLGFPILIDPMVMYWNRSLFTNARIAQPPVYWDELLDLGDKLTKKDAAFNVSQSVIALGEYSNVTHAREIIATLIMQAGDPITVRSGGDQVSFVLGDRFGLPEAPAHSALRFYTEFANPVKPAYSWNRSLPSSREAFLAGTLALYPGFGSELLQLQERNPNLNFDMAPLPQHRDSTFVTTFGDIYAIALVKQSKDIGGAYRVATLLSGQDASVLWADYAGIPPARRDLLGTPPNDPYNVILYDEALIAQGFLDPDLSQSGNVFSSLIGDIASGRSTIERAVSDAKAKLQNLVR
ncbi:MAG: hypothetical protein RLY47_72 [Candidatus Parcubacteria bacterium]